MAETLNVKVRGETGTARMRRLRHTGAIPAILYGHGEANVNLVASVSKELTKRYHAGNIIKELAGMVGGGGGGRADFAQAGGKDPAKIDAALKRAEELIRQAK